MTDALTTLSLLTLAQEYRGDIVHNINRKCATLKMLKVVAGSGKNIAWAPKGDGALAENYAEGADQTSFGRDIQTSAILNWGLYRSAIHVSELALDTSATSSTPEGNRQLWAEQLVEASSKLSQQINQEIFAGPGTGTRMAGMVEAVGKNDNTYAAVDRTSSSPDYSFFQPTVVDPGTDTTLTMALVRDDIRKVYEACGMEPDMAVCSPAVFNVVGALFDNTRRQVSQVRDPSGKITLDMGFQAVECDGTVFYRDKDCTAKTIYYLNSDHVRVQYLPSPEQTKMMEALGGELLADDGFGAVPIGLKYAMLAKAGASEKAMVTWTGGLVVDRPNSCAARKHISVS